MMSEKRFTLDDEVFELEYNALQEMLIVNHQDGFSYNMCDEDDVFSVATKLNEQEATINELEETNKAMYKRLKEQSEIIYQLIQKLKRHMTEEELKELIEDCGL